MKIYPEFEFIHEDQQRVADEGMQDAVIAELSSARDSLRKHSVAIHNNEPGAVSAARNYLLNCIKTSGTHAEILMMHLEAFVTYADAGIEELQRTKSRSTT